MIVGELVTWIFFIVSIVSIISGSIMFKKYDSDRMAVFSLFVFVYGVFSFVIALAVLLGFYPIGEWLKIWWESEIC